MSLEVYAAGAAAAFTVDILIYPLDTLKTRYQSQDFVKAYSKDSKQSPLAFRGLYQGIGSVVLATLPAAGIFFSTYESTKTLFGRILPFPEPLVNSSASGVAEMASCLVLAPAEVVKQNAQMLRSQGHDKSLQASTSLRAFRQLGGQGAGKRLFTGYSALVARNLPFTALQFPAFEHIRKTLWASRESKRGTQPRGLVETGFISATSAASAGAFAACVTTPSDVVKTRMMLMAGDNAGNSKSEDGKPTQRSWEVTQQVYKERGLRGFFRGGFFRSAWTALGSGLYLGTYDVAKLYLTRKKPDIEDAVGL